MAERKIIVLGGNGQIGWELQRTLAPLGSVLACGRGEADLADVSALRRLVREVAPRLIVNAAAYTAVDRAEGEPERAGVVNGIAPGVLAEEAKRLRTFDQYVSPARGTQAGYLIPENANPTSEWSRSPLMQPSYSNPLFC